MVAQNCKHTPGSLKKKVCRTTRRSVDLARHRDIDPMSRNAVTERPRRSRDAVDPTKRQTRCRDITSEFETSLMYAPRFLSRAITPLARSFVRLRARVVRRRRETQTLLSLLFGSCQLPLTQLPRLCSPAS